MATWTDLRLAAPDIATEARALWDDSPLAYLATIRRDGSPRVHPVVPVWAGDDVHVAIGWWSPKWRDLERDARCVLHALPGPRDDEIAIRARALPADDARDAVRAAAHHTIHDADHVVRLDIEQVDHGWWEHVGRPDTHAVRRRWTPTDGVVTLDAGPRPPAT